MPTNTPILSGGITDACRIDSASGAKLEAFLAIDLLACVVAHTPLAAIDLIVINSQRVARPRQQHSQYNWMQPGQAMQHLRIHPYTQVYFESIPK